MARRPGQGQGPDGLGSGIARWTACWKPSTTAIGPLDWAVRRPNVARWLGDIRDLLPLHRRAG